MALPTNILQQVQTYQRAMLGYLSNLNCIIGKVCNTKFKEFEKIPANLGSTVTFDLPPRFTSTIGLVATWQPAVQRVQTLTVDQAQNVSYPFTAQEKIFNVDKDTESYMVEFGKSATEEFGSKVEINVALNAISAVPVCTVVNGQTVPTGALHTESGPFRFADFTQTQLTSYQQLSQMIENYKEFGAVKNGIQVVLPNVIIPPIIGSGLNQFAPNRNNADAMSWEIGSFGTPPVEYLSSNLLPTHTSGNVGNAAPTASPSNVLTVISTNDPTGANITAITFSGAGTSDTNAIFSGDLGQFVDGVSGQPNLRFLTFIGGNPTNQPVQIRALANAGSDGSGHVTISFYPPLQSTAGATQNLTSNIVAGMKLRVVPTHKAGFVSGGKAFYLAMPELPDQSPFATAYKADPETAVSIRVTTGATFGQNIYGTILDGVWGSTFVPEYGMRICLPA